MYNTRFTKAFDGKPTMGRSCRAVKDREGRIVCGVGKKAIVDLKGNRLAVLNARSKQKDERGEVVLTCVYHGDEYDFRLVGSRLYRGEELIGTVKAGTVDRKTVTLLSLLSATLALILVTLALLDIPPDPDKEIPVIDIMDGESSWDAVETIAVLDASVKPGSSGEYPFHIRNPHRLKLKYKLTVTQLFNGEPVEVFPIEYGLRMNNVPLQIEKSTQTGVVLECAEMIFPAESQQNFTLEWEWKFENGNDGLDTALGIEGGSYSLIVQIDAEPVGGAV